MRKYALLTAAALIIGGTMSTAWAIFPYGQPDFTPPDVYDYKAYLFILDGDVDGDTSTNDIPDSVDNVSGWEDALWYLFDYQGSDLMTSNSPQEMYAFHGMGVNQAWEITTGRPDVVIAVIDSGIRWEEEERMNLVKKYYINRGELPMPAGGPNASDTRFGGYDVNGDGAFNVEDYWNDPSATDLNGNGVVDPDDLIHIFSDGVDDDNNGYVDDISGWDFYENDNNPLDDVDHGHGTGEAIDSTAEMAVDGEGCQDCPGSGLGEGPGTAPNCMMMPCRVGSSFIADVNHFSEAVIYAVDNGASVIQEALGTLNHTSFGQAAIDYAYENGVIINASQADEAAAHHNWPAAYERTMVVNSIRNTEIGGTNPATYLLLNGCTNFGGYSFLSIPSTACSSHATGVSSGVSGLLVSAARNAVENGKMTNYIKDDGSQAGFPMSAEEMMQLWRLSGDDVDFSTPYPYHEFSQWFEGLRGFSWLGPQYGTNDYGLISQPLSVIGVATHRYQTVKGWDYFTGYGRCNAARLLRFIGIEDMYGTSREWLPDTDVGPWGVGADVNLTAQDRIPPEIDITSPIRWRQYGYKSGYELLVPDDANAPAQIVVEGRVAANRVTSAGGTFDYVVEWAPGAQGIGYPDGMNLTASDSEEHSAGPWNEVSRVTGLTSAYEGELARINVSDVATAIAANPDPFALEGDPTNPAYGSEDFAVRLRVRVLSHPVNPNDDVNNEAVKQKQIDVYAAPETVLRNDIGLNGAYAGASSSPSFHDINGDGVDELVLPSDDGVIHAYTNVATGEELPGWPVLTEPYSGIRMTGVNAYTNGDVPTNIRGSILTGSAAVADLDDDGLMEVIVADVEGHVYAWEPDGSLRAGFPVTVDYNLSKEIPDDLGAGDRRDRWNSRDWAIWAPPSVGDLDPTYPGLEIVAACLDSHVYAWHADGTPVDGWPVILRDPTKIDAMDPDTHMYSYIDQLVTDGKVYRGSKLITTPSLGDIDGDGDLEVVIAANEQYIETPNAYMSDTFIEWMIDNLAGQSGNGRIYALHHTGAATPGTPETDATVHTQDQAYVAGWPVPIAITVVDLLPDIAAGPNHLAPLADIDNDGTLEIMTATHLGPAYILDHDGLPFLGYDHNLYETLDRLTGDYGAGSQALDGSSLIALSGVSVGSMSGGQHLTVGGGGGGIIRVLDILIEGRQYEGEDHMQLWNASTGDFETNSPLIVNDLQFFTAPIFADITGDGYAEAIQQTAMSDLVAADLNDTSDTATRYHTGGWHIGTAAVGSAPLGSLDNGTLSIANVSREGWLRVFHTLTPSGDPIAQAAVNEWPEYAHDAHNSGNYETDATHPYPVTGTQATSQAGAITLEFNATGDDRQWGTATSYAVRKVDGLVSSPAWGDGTDVDVSSVVPQAAGSQESIALGTFPDGDYTFMIRAYDEAGNGSAIRTAQVSNQPNPPEPASNPSPGNGAVSVDRDANLSWTAGVRATSHDVYFGTSNPPAVVQNQAASTYDPGTMTLSTTYYWRIDEVNIDGTTTGPVWSFTVEAPTPPAKAQLVSPANGATGVSVDANPDIVWTAGTGAVSHNVHFGTTNPPAFVQNQTGLTYNASGSLSEDTTYYWRIDEVNGDGTTTGDVWSFTTESGGCSGAPIAPGRPVTNGLGTAFVPLLMGLAALAIWTMRRRVTRTVA